MNIKRNKGMSTLDIIIIILASLLALSIVVVLVLFGVFGMKKSSNTNKTETEKEESYDDSVNADVADGDSDSGNAEVTDGDSDSGEESVVDDTYRTAYGEVIRKNLQQINDYKWQFGYDYSDGYPEPSKEPRPVALCDLNADGIDELFYMYATDEYSASVQIDTYLNGTVVELYGDAYDIMVAGGFYYCMFQVEGDDDLYILADGGDEMWDTYIRQFHLDDTGSFNMVHEWHWECGPNEDYTDSINIYTLDGNSIDEAEYKAKKTELGDSITKIILYNSELSRYELSSADESKFIGMNMYDTFQATPQGVKVSDEEAQALYASLPSSFNFSSGVGAWGTSVTINTDGTFTGGYHDSNMGESGEGYDATVYYSNFSGSFKEVRKVNDYTYALYLDHLITEDIPDTERIENAEGAKVRYVASEPYGMDGSPEFYIYTPDAPIEQLPETYRSWVYGLNESGPLGMYGLYNTVQCEGFSSQN